MPFFSTVKEKEKVTVETDSKQKLIERVKTQGCVESITVGPRMGCNKPTIQHMILATTAAVVKTQRVKNPSNEVKPATVNGTTDDRKKEDQRLKPFVPSVQCEATQSRKSGSSDSEDRPKILEQQSPKATAQLRHIQQQRKQDVKDHLQKQ
ncbi:hypothetical protein GCK32_017783 [Trichostrongylus colubriformis]|uniref:Uncharacterized protein n=1 Tax=Trichostrongylus colubriformis TaxID=6319 RepID=A0AAN8INQ6_TRICO